MWFLCIQGIESRNHEQAQKNKNMEILFYRWNWLYDGWVQENIFFTRGPRGKKIDNVMTNFEIPKKIVVLRKESR